MIRFGKQNQNAILFRRANNHKEQPLVEKKRLIPCKKRGLTDGREYNIQIRNSIFFFGLCMEK